MKLHYNKLGEGPPLLILHGLYGNGDNWFAIARKLEKDFTVYLIDQRNHGKSPHSEEINYQLMAEDLRELVLNENLKELNILGHSMGGKVAMTYANTFPDSVNKLIVVDISPRSYVPEGRKAMQARFHESTIQTLLGLNIEKAKTRTDLDKELSEHIQNPAIRQFLLKNIRRSDEGYFYWQINLKAFANNLEELFSEVPLLNSEVITNFPVLFIKGENSGYLNASDPELISHYYKDFRIENIPNTGHWVHAEAPDTFTTLVRTFLLK